MKKKSIMTYRLWASALLLLGMLSCSKEDGERPAADPERTTVLLNIVSEKATDAVGPGTKATSSLIPDVENLIRDIWVIQYDAQGVARTQYTKHYRETDSPVRELHSFPVELAVLPNCTVCFVVNLNPGQTGLASPWANTLVGFKDQYTEIAYQSGMGVEGLPDAQGLYMFGCYEGDITSATPSLNVTLGRMLSCINLMVENTTGVELTGVKVTVENAVRRAYYYVSMENPALSATDYTSFTDTVGTLTAGETAYFFYYVAPNLSPAAGTETTVTVQANKNDALVSTGAVALGSTADDHTINRNGNYTITLSLR